MSSLGRVDLREPRNKSIACQEAGHHTLIVTEKACEGQQGI